MKRLEEVLIADKFANLDRVSEVLKEEITPIAQNFFELSQPLVVRFKKEGNRFVFDVQIDATRVKPFGMRI